MSRKERGRGSFSGERRIVYDTDAGGRVALCKKCGQPTAQCRCRDDSSAESSGLRDGFVRLARDKSGRKGRVVTVVTGLPGDADALAQIAQEMRRLCGAGGTVKGTAIE